MKKKIYVSAMTLLCLSLVLYMLSGNRMSINKVIGARNNNKDIRYSRLIMDKISKGEIIFSVSDEKKVRDVLYYIGKHYITPADNEITIDDNTYSLNFYGDKIEDGMTITIDSKGFVEIYTIIGGKSELKNYKIIENTINIDKIKKLSS